MSELKHCPFCGGNELSLYQLDVGKAHMVFCRACRAEGPVAAIDEDQSIEAWNTRTPDYATLSAAARELVEAARWRDEVRIMWELIESDDFYIGYSAYREIDESFDVA